MNRQQRRREQRLNAPMAATTAPRTVSAPAGAAIVAKPSILLRMAAWIMLSDWVLRRVEHPAVRQSLAMVARQVGRQDLAARLEQPGTCRS